jgi:MFS family permease
MLTDPTPPTATPTATPLLIGAAALLALAVAMGVGRFAFTPLFPLMVRDGLLSADSGAWLAAANYLGYLLGALLAGRLPVLPARLLQLGLLGIVLLTAAVGCGQELLLWAVLRFLAGLLSAWALVATSAWGLGWLAACGRPQLAGVIYAGVGTGITVVGLFCLLLPTLAPASRAGELWQWLGLAAALPALFAIGIAQRHPRVPVPTGTASPATTAAPTANANANATNQRWLIASYSLFGFGYILPATYLPAQARQLIDDPQVFGWAWPVFGLAAAVSTLVVAFGLRGANRLRLWAVCHLLLAAGVVLPLLWRHLAAILGAALLVGSTFMVITMLGMQEARHRASGPQHATRMLGYLTAGFALGQLLGPLLPRLLANLPLTAALAFPLSLLLAAAGLLASAGVLWRQSR